MELTEQILDALTRVQERTELLRHGLSVVQGGLTLAEVHCVAWIVELEHANVTRLAKQMAMTRGAISKIAKRLLSKRLIESYRLPGNNKEIYYRLTETGSRLAEEHAHRHAAARRSKAALLEGYSEAELSAVLRFLTALNHLNPHKEND
ncbi:DNA-binding transcriptional regulator, MarR family [Humidesulfovibrio mexicanus]|uniref:DNA-binding transcriptional regulator, MarR family n=1 Tax=Humidesulfovibrio mexicanus TaxID=147047 RepID=A0A239C5N5_9BACT|nr:MarR family transcriptional regulator [Humidesulfovibrio mexicanus]SNS14951.1 DNA-binding transcriptional regulator, MarR family [Humidesulfovibrio mexicanus]